MLVVGAKGGKTIDPDKKAEDIEAWELKHGCHYVLMAWGPNRAQRRLIAKYVRRQMRHDAKRGKKAA